MKKCKTCKSEFVQYSTLQNLCVDCLIVKGRKIAVKNSKTVVSTQKRELKAQKEEIKPRSYWIKKAQAAFNPYIRARDKDKPCPSCLRHDHEIPDTPFGKWDCGHFLSVGSHPELRFEPLNAYKQCKKCNGGSGNYAKKNHTVTKQYELTLIEWIGIEKVEWLKGPHEPKKYTIDDLKIIEAEFKQKLKQLTK